MATELKLAPVCFYPHESLMVRWKLPIVLRCWDRVWRAPLEHTIQIRGQTMERAKAREGLSTARLSVRWGAGARLLEPFGELEMDSNKETQAREEWEKNRTTSGRVLDAQFLLFGKERGCRTHFWSEDKCVLKFSWGLKICEFHHFIQKIQVRFGISLNDRRHKCSKN